MVKVIKGRNIRYHEYMDNKVVSVYIEGTNNNHHLFYDNVNYSEDIGVVISKSRRFNNDWYNGDKKGDKIHNRSTGSIKCLLSIVDTLTIHVLEYMQTYKCDYYFTCTPTDKHRETTYLMIAKRVCKQCNIDYECVKLIDGELQFHLIY